MNKLLISVVMCSTLIFVGCDLFKNKADAEKNVADKPLLEDWSCTAEANLTQIQNHLKDEYLKELDRSLRRSNYPADQEILEKIKKGIKFELKGVTTLTQDVKTAKELECSSQLIVHLPKGLQQRAENSFLEHPCDECESQYDHERSFTLHDFLEEGEFGLSLKNNQLHSKFNYGITKTDKEGLSLSVPNQISVIDGVVVVSKYASEYEAYVKENKELHKNSKQYEEERTAQIALAQKSMDIRKKELESEKGSIVERLNQTWDRLSDEQKEKLKQNQAEWFEKRDVDCKVLAQKSVHALSDNEEETYQKHNQYWSEDMFAQNTEMQYTKCFNQKTTERIVYLNNFF